MLTRISYKVNYKTIVHIMWDFKHTNKSPAQLCTICLNCFTFSPTRGVQIAYKGRCTCACPRDRNPVCGSNGLTYDNACLAKCE